MRTAPAPSLAPTQADLQAVARLMATAPPSTCLGASTPHECSISADGLLMFDSAGQQAPLRVTARFSGATPLATRRSQRRGAALMLHSSGGSPRSTGGHRLRCARGRLPNIHWRSLTIDELRQHPQFVPLPPVRGLRMAGPPTFKWVRQDDSLWDELHHGVLTSRFLLATLGFREERAATRLGLTRAMRDPMAMVDAYAYFRGAGPGGARWAGEGCSLHVPPQSKVDAAEEANTALRSARHHQRSSQPLRWPPATAWLDTEMSSAKAPRSLSAVRTRWGSAQEAAALAAILYALPSATMEEVGLAMLDTGRLPEGISAEVQKMAAAGELPPIGASPDAMLRPRQGAPVETVEVKNACPFFSRREDGDAFRTFVEYIPQLERRRVPWYERRGPAESIPPQYVPQVQMEMLVTGTRRNNFVSASAVQGMNLIVMERDDAYLSEMLHFIGRFWSSVRLGSPPTEDLHWQETERFKAFLDAAVRLGKSAKVSRHIAQPWRRDASGAAARLFLDSSSSAPRGPMSA